MAKSASPSYRKATYPQIVAIGELLKKDIELFAEGKYRFINGADDESISRATGAPVRSVTAIRRQLFPDAELVKATASRRGRPAGRAIGLRFNALCEYLAEALGDDKFRTFIIPTGKDSA